MKNWEKIRFLSSKEFVDQVSNEAFGAIPDEARKWLFAENNPSERVVYKGIMFANEVEARWAVFFDAVGVNWEYHPGHVLLKCNKTYDPTFVVHGVESRGSEILLYIDVVGVPDETRYSLEMCLFAEGHSLLFVTGIPDGNSLLGLLVDVKENYHCERYPGVFDFNTVDGDNYLAMPAANENRKLVLVGPDWAQQVADEAITVNAYKTAREFKF